jgi:putative Mg2+ transporter-C (MgtC) family protein
MQGLVDQIRGLDLAPLLLAVLLGGLIGFEREAHGRPAGLRTHILVCMVSALIIHASKRVPDLLVGDVETARVVFDPNRLAAGIMTGIGFLGAATVVRSGDIVRGITTGATVWSVAGLGIVIGQGEYALAMLGTGILFLVLVGLDRVARNIKPVIYRRLIVRGDRPELTQVAARIRAILSEHSIRVMDLSGRQGAEDEPFELVFHIRARDTLAAPQMIEMVAGEKGILSVEWSQLAH